MNPPLRILSQAVLLKARGGAAFLRRLTTKTGDEEWNDAWESAWLPDDLSGKNRPPWEPDLNFALPEDSASPPSEASSSSLYSLESIKRDYRLRKQRIHAGLWLKEIDKMEESKLGDSGDHIDKLLDSCSEIFDSPNDDLNNSNATTSELKNKPDGWETTSKMQDGNIWEMSQREEDILVQEFERRIAFNKFQIASFIKTHIFSRRRPIDGWKYMIEEIGPNCRKGKGSVSRLPSIADASIRPFREEVTSPDSTFPSNPRGNGR